MHKYLNFVLSEENILSLCLKYIYFIHTCTPANRHIRVYLFYIFLLDVFVFGFFFFCFYLVFVGRKCQANKFAFIRLQVHTQNCLNTYNRNQFSLSISLLADICVCARVICMRGYIALFCFSGFWCQYVFDQKANSITHSAPFQID